MKKNAIITLVYLVLSSLFMGFTDVIWQPGYAMKSAVKIILFILIPLFFIIKTKSIELKRILTFPAQTKFILFLGVVLYILIVAGYFALRDVVDLSNIPASLEKSMGVTTNNFIFVALYISVINSFIEELFFRGVSFQLLKPFGKYLAMSICSLIFSLYHVAMMIGWYDGWIFSLAIIALFIAGFLFHLLNEKNGSIYHSWIIHLFANLGINTVGYIILQLA